MLVVEAITWTGCRKAVLSIGSVSIEPRRVWRTGEVWIWIHKISSYTLIKPKIADRTCSWLDMTWRHEGPTVTLGRETDPDSEGHRLVRWLPMYM